jgi:ferredoxin
MCALRDAESVSKTSEAIRSCPIGCTVFGGVCMCQYRKNEGTLKTHEDAITRCPIGCIPNGGVCMCAYRSEDITVCSVGCYPSGGVCVCALTDLKKKK